jgi:pimeloyl-ACP methyl ester carboxylesterase
MISPPALDTLQLSEGGAGIRTLAAVTIALVVLATPVGCGGGQRSAERSWKETEVFFPSGENRLFGLLALPTRDGPHPALVLLSGSDRGGVDTPLLSMHARRLAAAGFAVLRYDPPGVGRSGGEPGFETLADRADEAIAAAEFLRSRPEIRKDEVGLWGESQGGWVTQMAAAVSPDIAYIVSVSGSGVPVAEQQVYSVEAQSRAAGLSPLDTAKATLVIRLLIDGQLTHDLYEKQNRAAVGRLGPGPWTDLASIVYARKPVPAAEGLRRTIAILKQIRTESWAQFLYLDTTYLHALEAIPPPLAEAALAAAEQSLIVDPRDFLTRVRSPVLAFFGEDDTVVPARRSAALYRRYLRRAGNEDVTIVVAPHADHSLGGFPPAYWEALTDWLTHQTGE